MQRNRDGGRCIHRAAAAAVPVVEWEGGVAAADIGGGRLCCVARKRQCQRRETGSFSAAGVLAELLR